MQITIRGFEVDHNRFTPVSSVRSHYTRISNKLNLRPRTLLGLNFFIFFGPKLCSSVPVNIKKIKKDGFNINIRNVKE